MAPQPSFPPYEVSLLSIKSQNQILFCDPSEAEPSYFSQEPKVLHLTNSGDSSFIGLECLQNLYAAQLGSDKALPEIDASTEVQLRTRFVGVKEAQVTTHRVLFAPQYDIIFIRQDWEGPVQQYWTKLNSEPKSGHKSSPKSNKRSSRKKQHKQHQPTQRRKRARTLKR